MMRLHTKDEGGAAAINLTPLIDMVFILLIFFAVNSTFVKFPGVDVEQPVAKTATVQQASTILIAVTSTGEVWIDKKQVKSHHFAGESAQRMQETVDALIAGILANQFEATPSEDACRFCRYKRICPEAVR